MAESPAGPNLSEFIRRETANCLARSSVGLNHSGGALARHFAEPIDSLATADGSLSALARRPL